MARILNASVARGNGRLSPLKDSNDADVPGFPTTLMELYNMSSMTSILFWILNLTETH